MTPHFSVIPDDHQQACLWFTSHRGRRFRRDQRAWTGLRPCPSAVGGERLILRVHLGTEEHQQPAIREFHHVRLHQSPLRTFQHRFARGPGISVVVRKQTPRSDVRAPPVLSIPGPGGGDRNQYPAGMDPNGPVVQENMPAGRRRRDAHRFRPVRLSLCEFLLIFASDHTHPGVSHTGSEPEEHHKLSIVQSQKTWHPNRLESRTGDDDAERLAPRTSPIRRAHPTHLRVVVVAGPAEPLGERQEQRAIPQLYDIGSHIPGIRFGGRNEDRPVHIHKPDVSYCGEILHSASLRSE